MLTREILLKRIGDLPPGTKLYSDQGAICVEDGDDVATEMEMELDSDEEDEDEDEFEEDEEDEPDDDEGS